MSLGIFRDHDGRGEDNGDRAHGARSGDTASLSSSDAVIVPQSNRSFGPDLIRAVAAILVVYLHAGVAYLNHPMPGLVWATQDTPSSVVSHLFWSIELFIMPLFLLLAGFFAYRSWIASGDIGLIRSRARRLLVPMLAGGIVLLPTAYLIWLVGWVIDGSVPADRLWPPKFPRDMRQHLFGFAHLWFLLYVFLYCVVLAGFGLLRRNAFAKPDMEAIASEGPSGGRFGKSSQALFVLVCALPLVGTSVLWWAPEVVFGFQHAFAPVASKWLYSGTFFFGGVAMAAIDPRMSFATVKAERLIGVGAVCGVAAIMLGQWAIERADSTSLAMEIGLVARVSLASLTVVSAWTTSLGLIGLGNLASPILLQRPKARRGIAYVAAASFWIYLVHHPIVALLHIDLKLVLPGFSPLAKSLIVTLVALGTAIASYEVMIRGRVLGRVLGLDGSVQKPAASAEVMNANESKTIEFEAAAVKPTASIPDRSIRRAA
jgi:peptidoglycan/LPS O-acetylase OafA/YrhL